MTCPVLIADAGEWVGAIVTVVSILIYIVNQFFEHQKTQQQNEQAARRRRQAQAEWEAQQAENWRAPPVQQPANKPLVQGNEVDQFLREVERLRRGASQTVEAEVVEAEVVEDQPRRPLGAGVQQHVSQYIEERNRQLTQHVAKTVSTDDIKSKIDEKIHAKFDHQVGTLEDGPEQDEEVNGPQATYATPSPVIGALFSDPARLRQLFIVQEILERPDQRW